MDKRRCVVVGLVMAMVAALSGCNAAGPASSPGSRAPAHSEQAARSGHAHRSETLRALVELERQAVETSGKRLEHLRLLYDSGRIGEDELFKAELDALEWRRRFLLDRLQLQLHIDDEPAGAAQHGAAAADRPQAGDRG